MQKRPVTYYKPARHDRVYRRGDPDRDLGTITDAGIEQSEVKWDDTDYGRGYYPNTELVKLGG